MMSYGEQLKIYGERSELASDKFCEQIIEFERLVSEMRKEQKAFSTCKKEDAKTRHLKLSKELEQKVDSILFEMGWDDRQHIF